MVVFLNRGPQYEPQNTIVLIMGTLKKVPLILGNPQISHWHEFLNAVWSVVRGFAKRVPVLTGWPST